MTEKPYEAYLAGYFFGRKRLHSLQLGTAGLRQRQAGRGPCGGLFKCRDAL